MQLSENLQKTSVNVIPKEICNGNQSYHGNVPNSSFCAGSTQGKICNVKSFAIFSFLIYIPKHVPNFNFYYLLSWDAHREIMVLDSFAMA